MYFTSDYQSFSIVFIFLYTLMESNCKENCHYVDLKYTNWTDDRPRFVVNMTFSNQNGIGSITTINEEVSSPISSLLIEQQVPKEKKRVIYNVTTKLCTLQSIFNSVPLFKPVQENMLKQSNYTFSCPLKKGVYVMSNMRINPRNPLLGLMYQVKGTFFVKGALYAEMPHDILHSLSTYYLTGRIIKKNCVKND